MFVNPPCSEANRTACLRTVKQRRKRRAPLWLRLRRAVSFPSLRCHRYQRVVIEKILRHLGQWTGTSPLAPARASPDANAGPWTREPCDDVDPMPDYENVLTD